MTDTLTLAPATPRQIQFLASLLERKARTVLVLDGDNGGEAALAVREHADDLLTGREVPDKRTASSMISTLKAWLDENVIDNADGPRQPRREVLSTGMYIRNDVVFRVVRSARGYLYAKRLVPGGARGRFEYDRQAIRFLTPADVLTAEKAAAYGRKARAGYDGSISVYCACCGIELDTAESRERGIGPVCFSRHFG